jgi:hypothetical protein
LKVMETQDIRLSAIKDNNTAQLIKVEHEGKTIDLINLHAPLVHNRTYWKNFCAEHLNSNAILCGDFNLGGNDKMLKQLKESYSYLNEENTYYNYVEEDGQVLDYTFLPKNLYRLASQEVIKTEYSDHHILISNIEIL